MSVRRMGEKVKQWSGTLYARLFFTFIAILIPLLVLGYIVYNWGLTTVKYDISSSRQTQVDFYNHSISQELQRLRLLQYDLFNDTSLNKLMVQNNSMTNYDRGFSLNLLQERLVTIKGSSRYVDQVKVILPAMQTTISNLIINEWNASDRALIEAFRNSKNRGGLTYVKGNLYLLASSPNSIQLNGQDSFAFIAIALSDNNLRQMLTDLQVYRNSNAFLFSSNLPILIQPEEKNQTAQGIRKYIVDSGFQYRFNGYDLLRVDQETYFITYNYDKRLDLAIVSYIPLNQIFRKINDFKALFFLYAATAVIITVIFAISLYRYIHAPLSMLSSAFHKVEIGNLQFEIKHRRKDEFSHIFQRFNSMLRNLNSLIEQVYKQKILLRNSELKQLQTQINPHFLYNSFFVLHRWIKYDYKEEAVLFSKYLGQYFEFVTRSTVDEVPLGREVEHARTYAEIQGMRFSSRIHTEFADMPTGIGHVMVPRLILQPVIENAFEHGLEAVLEDGKLIVKLQLSDDRIEIVVEDNGEGLTEEKLWQMSNELQRNSDDDEVTGLLNIHRRLQLKFGEQCGVQVERSSLGGLKVTLTITKEND